MILQKAKIKSKFFMVFFKKIVNFLGQCYFMPMKLFFTLFLMAMSFNLLADSASKSEIKKLKKIISPKTVSCQPTKYNTPIDPEYKGDEGFFKFKIQKNKLVIFDNGTSGFGFSSGNFRDLNIGEEDLFLSVGDDGYQILTLHLGDLGSDTPDCAQARLISYFDGYHSGGDEEDSLKCCLE